MSARRRYRELSTAEFLVRRTFSPLPCATRRVLERRIRGVVRHPRRTRKSVVRQTIKTSKAQRRAAGARGSRHVAGTFQVPCPLDGATVRCPPLNSSYDGLPVRRTAQRDAFSKGGYAAWCVIRDGLGSPSYGRRVKLQRAQRQAAGARGSRHVAGPSRSRVRSTTPPCVLHR